MIYNGAYIEGISEILLKIPKVAVYLRVCGPLSELLPLDLFFDILIGLILSNVLGVKVAHLVEAGWMS